MLQEKTSKRFFKTARKTEKKINLDVAKWQSKWKIRDGKKITVLRGKSGEFQKKKSYDISASNSDYFMQ